MAMTEKQEILREILKEVVEIFERNGIKYFLCGTSALGAINKGGFCENDESLKIGLMNDEWGSAKAVLNKYLPTYYAIVDRESYTDFTEPYAQIVDKNTTCYFKGDIDDNYPKGIHLDIFMYYSIQKKNIKNARRDFWLYCELINPYRCVLNENLWYDDCAVSAYTNTKVVGRALGVHNRIGNLEKSFSGTPINQGHYLMISDPNTANFYPIKNFRSLKKVRFEDLDVLVPCGACDNLRIDFGDSWKEYEIPEPIEGETEIYDCNLSNEYYFAGFAGSIDMLQHSQDAKDNKLTELKNFKTEVKMMRTMLSIEGSVIKNRLRNISEQDMAIDKAAGRFQKIIAPFEEYIQFKRKQQLYVVDVDIDDDRKEILVFALIMAERIQDAAIVADVSRFDEMTDALNDLQRAIIALTQSVTAICDSRMDDAKKLLSAVPVSARSAVAFKRLAILLEKYSGKNN